MSTILGTVIGMLLGFFFIKKTHEKKVYEILVKKIGLNSDQLEFFIFNYQNYNTIKKESKKKLLNDSVQLEVAYNLMRDRVSSMSKSQNVSNVEELKQVEVPADVPQL